MGLLFEPIIFAMDRKMCLDIKRAEQLYEMTNISQPDPDIFTD